MPDNTMWRGDRDRDDWRTDYGRRDFDYERNRGDDAGYGARGRWDENRSFSGGDYRYGDRDNARFRNDDEDRRVPRNETSRLIASDKVEGTRVFDRRGNELGRIENFMVGKRSGKVEYAVLSFGGFLGMGERHYPLPWDQLTYDERLGGYVVDITERDLEEAPSHRAGSRFGFDEDYGRDVDRYYGRRY